MADALTNSVWAAPQIVGLYMRDTPDSHEAFELTVTFARFLLPQIFFYGLFGIYGQVLNAREMFGAMMWTPVLNNVVLVGMFAAYLGLMTVPDRVEDITADQVQLLSRTTAPPRALASSPSATTRCSWTAGATARSTGMTSPAGPRRQRDGSRRHPARGSRPLCSLPVVMSGRAERGLSRGAQHRTVLLQDRRGDRSGRTAARPHF